MEVGSPINSRYFTADFPYGLAIIVAFADVLECEISNIREMMDWYNCVVKSDSVFDLQMFGINNQQDISLFYQ